MAMDLIFESALIIGPILVAYVAWNERDKKAMKQRVEDKIEAYQEHLQQVRTATDMNTLKANEVKDDIHRLEAKIDKLLDRLIDNKL